jgi:hypothetical protein
MAEIEPGHTLNVLNKKKASSQKYVNAIAAHLNRIEF